MILETAKKYAWKHKYFNIHFKFQVVIFRTNDMCFGTH